MEAWALFKKLIDMHPVLFGLVADDQELVGPKKHRRRKRLRTRQRRRPRNIFN